MAKTPAAPRKKKAASETANAPIAKQYEQWVYPQPIMDLSTPEVRARRDGGDCASNYFTFWPNQAFRDDMDILIAGCGSNAAARYAFNHPSARVTGIDLSAASLEHEKYLQDKHGLKNLTLQQMRIEDISSLKQDFDFIDASGVLHHLPDPVAGLKALGGVLRKEGTIAVMLYGQYSRHGVYMMQDAFRLIGLEQSKDDVEIVKQTLAIMPKHHTVHDYLARANDTKYDAGLVDTFLHRQDKAYTVKQCLELTQQAGLNFMHWWDNILYYPEGQISKAHPLYQKLNALPPEDMWQFMELFNGTLGQHSFAVCRPDRAESSYKIDFASKKFMDYIPVLRSRILPHDIKAPQGCLTLQRGTFPAYTLNPAASALVRQFDGKKTVRECFEQSGLKEAGSTPAECITALQHLWRISYIFLRLPAA